MPEKDADEELDAVRAPCETVLVERVQELDQIRLLLGSESQLMRWRLLGRPAGPLHWGAESALIVT